MPFTNAPGIPYHRLARTGAHRWWRPVLGTLAVLVLGFAGFLAVFMAGETAGVIARRPVDADGLHSFGVAADLGLYLLSLGVLLPCVLLAARWVQGRPAGHRLVGAGTAALALARRVPAGAVPTLILMLAGGGAAVHGDRRRRDRRLRPLGRRRRVRDCHTAADHRGPVGGGRRGVRVPGLVPAATACGRTRRRLLEGHP